MTSGLQMSRDASKGNNMEDGNEQNPVSGSSQRFSARVNEGVHSLAPASGKFPQVFYRSAALASHLG